MADAYTGVGLGVQTPDMMTKLSQLLTVRQQQSELQQSQQTTRQRANLATYDWNRHLGKDGTIDLNTLGDPELQKAAGDEYPELLSRMVTAKSQQLEAKSRLLNLNTDQLNTYRGLIGGLLQDKDVVADNEKGRQKVNDAYVQFGEAYGKDALPVIEAYAKRLQMVPQGRMADAIRAVQMQAVDAGNQLEKQRPTYLPRGPESVNVNPYTPEGTAPNIPTGIPPGFHPFTDPRTQNTYLINEQTGETRDIGQGYPGQVPTGARGGVAPNAPLNAPPSSLPRPYVPGQAAATTEQAHAVSARTAAAIDQANRSPQAIDALSRARNILDTADLATGAQFGKFNEFRNALAGLGIVTDETTDANSLVKNLARYEATRASGAGLGHTDAARELNEKGSPNTKIDSKALKGIVSQSMATELAVQGYAKVQTGVTDPQQMARIENEFRNIPNLIEAYQYGLSRTPQEADEFLKEHGVSKAEISKARQKLRNLGAL